MNPPLNRAVVPVIQRLMRTLYTMEISPVAGLYGTLLLSPFKLKNAWKTLQRQDFKVRNNIT